MANNILKMEDKDRGAKVTLALQTQLSIYYSRGVENYKDNLQAQLKEYVDSRIDTFFSDLADEVFNRYDSPSQPRFLKAKGAKGWAALSRRHEKRKKHGRFFYETGTLKGEFNWLGKGNSATPVIKTLGGYYLKRKGNPQGFKSSGSYSSPFELRRTYGALFPTMKNNPEVFYRKVKLGTFSFSVFKILGSRQIPELLLDKLLPPMKRSERHWSTKKNQWTIINESIPVSLKLGIYKQRYRVKFYRPTILPYAKHWVDKRLTPQATKWLQQKALNEGKK